MSQSVPPDPVQQPQAADAADGRALDLTVHSLPAATVSEDARTRGGRWKMIIVMLLCASPVVASYFTYYVIRPDGRRNFGTLIEPQRALPAWSARTLDGTVLSMPALKGQWLLVSVGPGACHGACAHNLYLQKQLHAALGKERDRLDRVWLVIDGQLPDPVSRREMADATVLLAPRAQVAAWLQPESGHALEDHLYLVDPHGRWMMRFPPQLTLEGAGKAKRDLDRLLRASASWDNPGREP